MQNEQTGYGDISTASLTTSADFGETVGIEGIYHVECFDKDGNLKWKDTAPNLVVAAGKELMFTALLRTSGTYTTVGPFLGLVNSGGTYAAADTFASHGGWTEFTSYEVSSAANRGTAVFAAPSSTGTTPTNVTTCAAAAISFVITSVGGAGPFTIGGCFLVTGTGATSAFSNTTVGTLYSAGNFTGGTKTVSPADVLNVTYSTTATS